MQPIKIPLTRAQIEPVFSKWSRLVSILPTTFPEGLKVGEVAFFSEFYAGEESGRNFLAIVQAISFPYRQSGQFSDLEKKDLSPPLISPGDRLIFEISARIPNVVLVGGSSDNDSEASSRLGIYRDSTGLDFWVNCQDVEPPKKIEGEFGNSYNLEGKARVQKIKPRPGEFFLKAGGLKIGRVPAQAR